jgi:putative ABC transport system permease protein
MQNFSDTLGQVFRAIMANKLRSFLTMFGIAWGVGSLLVLVGLGEGFRSGQHKQFATLGNDLVMMWNGTIPALANQHTGMRPYQLTCATKPRCAAAGVARRDRRAATARSLRSQRSGANTSGHVTGVEPNCTVVRNIPMARAASSTTPTWPSAAAWSCWVRRRQLLFPGHPMLGETITINDRLYVIGRCASPSAAATTTGDNQKVYSRSPPCRNSSP